jgi:DNA-directed RNA polymerase specialized sigma24 family protein
VSSPGSVTTWIRELQTGNHQAAQHLWERYFRRLVGLARTKLRGTPRRAADEEDVALNAFDSFCRGAEQGRFPQLRDRNNLWPLLVLITVRKARDLVQHNRSHKRGGGRVQSQSVLDDLQEASSLEPGIEQVVGGEPTPDFGLEVAEEYQRLLDWLGEDKLRQIAELKLAGYTDPEVAQRLGCGLRTVERKLQRIRLIWSKEVPKGTGTGPLS